jgi:hypothetical protein
MNMAYYFQDQNHESRYLRDVAMWLGELRKIVKRWRQLWTKQQGKSLRLVTDRGNTVVYDSRFGLARRLPISAAELQTLRALTKPTHEEAVNGPTLELLGRKCLVFSERGRVMSLVPLEDSWASLVQDPVTINSSGLSLLTG